MNGLAHYGLALLVMALLAGVMLATRHLGGGADRDARDTFDGCCGGCDGHRDASTHSGPAPRDS